MGALHEGHRDLSNARFARTRLRSSRLREPTQIGPKRNRRIPADEPSNSRSASARDGNGVRGRGSTRGTSGATRRASTGPGALVAKVPRAGPRQPASRTFWTRLLSIMRPDVATSDRRTSAASGYLRTMSRDRARRPVGGLPHGAAFGRDCHEARNVPSADDRRTGPCCRAACGPPGSMDPEKRNPENCAGSAGHVPGLALIPPRWPTRDP